MNHSDLVAKAAEKSGLSKKDMERALKATAEVTHAALQEGDEVTLLGFGKFFVKESAERKGRNPKTGEALTIAAKKSPKFTAAKALKDAVA